MTPAERHLIGFLRITAVILLLAAPAVIMPTPWMRWIAEVLGLELPPTPLTEYLTRSVSALYAGLGAAFWFMSGEVSRYLPLLRFTVWATLAFDFALIALDLLIPMPWMWTLGESVAVLAWTALLWWLVRRCSPA